MDLIVYSNSMLNRNSLFLYRFFFQKQKVLNSCPMELQLVKRFWKYILDREVRECFDSKVYSLSFLSDVSELNS